MCPGAISSPVKCPLPVAATAETKGDAAAPPPAAVRPSTRGDAGTGTLTENRTRDGGGGVLVTHVDALGAAAAATRVSGTETPALPLLPPLPAAPGCTGGLRLVGDCGTLVMKNDVPAWLASAVLEPAAGRENAENVDVDVPVVAVTVGLGAPPRNLRAAWGGVGDGGADHGALGPVRPALPVEDVSYMLKGSLEAPTA